MIGIGTEILCLVTGGLDTSGYEESNARIVAAERIARRWKTERGSAFWAPSMGLGLDLLSNADLSARDLKRIEVDARQEAMRVNGVTAALVTASFSGGQLTLTGRFKLEVGGWFTLTAAPGEAATVLLESGS